MKNRYYILVAGTLMLMFTGLIYAWSIFLKPIESAFLWNRSQTSHIFTFSIVSFCLGGVCGGFIIQKLKAAWIIRIAAALIALGFLISSQITQIWQIYISYGILCGFGVGLVYNAVLTTIVRWFPDRASFCSGMLLMGFGSGSLILGTVTGLVIEQFGWQTAFIVIAVACAIVLLSCSLFIHPPTESESVSYKKSTTAKKKAYVPPVNDIASKEMLKDQSFWIIFCWGILATACGLSVIGQSSPLTSSVGASAATAAFATGFISVFNGAGRIVLGIVYNKVPRKMMMYIISACFFLASIILLISASTNFLFLVFIGFALIGLAYGAVPTFGVSIVREFFGPKFYSANMSLLNVNLIFGVVLGSSLAGQFVGNGTYTGLLVFSAIVSASSFIVSLFMKKKDDSFIPLKQTPYNMNKYRKL